MKIANHILREKSLEHNSDNTKIRSTTVLAVKYGNEVVIAGDGQVSLGNTVMKNQARKIKRLHDGKVIAGIAGSGADAVALLERLDGFLDKHSGILRHAAIELAKSWRTDKYLRKLEALIAVADSKDLLMIGGTGDLIEPDDGLIAIGSGGPYALAAARAIIRLYPEKAKNSPQKISAKEIAKISLETAAGICVYTNSEISMESIPLKS